MENETETEGERETDIVRERGRETARGKESINLKDRPIKGNKAKSVIRKKESCRHLYQTINVETDSDNEASGERKFTMIKNSITKIAKK